MIDSLLNKNDEFEAAKNRLASLYDIASEHAGCYLCNYEDKYICHEFKGECKYAEQCKSIREREGEEYVCSR